MSVKWAHWRRIQLGEALRTTAHPSKLIKINVHTAGPDDATQVRVAMSPKKYTIYFYVSSIPSVHPFADPTQEVSSLDEARTFAQNAAGLPLVETARSFRIESDDRTVNELWTRAESGWKLHLQKGEI